MTSNKRSKIGFNALQLHKGDIILFVINHVGFHFTIKRERRVSVASGRVWHLLEYENNLLVFPIMCKSIFDCEPISKEYLQMVVRPPVQPLEFSCNVPHTVKYEKHMQLRISVKI